MAPVVDVETLLIDSGRRLSEGTTGGGGGILGLLLILLLICYCKDKRMCCFASSSARFILEDGRPQRFLDGPSDYNPNPVYIPDTGPIYPYPNPYPDPSPIVTPPRPDGLGPMHRVGNNYYYETQDSDGRNKWHRARHTGFDTGPGSLRSGQYASREEIEGAGLDWNGYLGR